MKRGRRPHYPLSAVKAVLADVRRLNWTVTAADGADGSIMDAEAVVEVIARLAVRNFEKSMLSEADPTIWQDVYKSMGGAGTLCQVDGR
jgi:hypothetical protein